MKRQFLSTMLGLAALVATGTAAADTITLRTGVDAGNTVLAAGATDTAWTISTDGGATYSDARVLFPAQICCGMQTVAGTAAWISDPSVQANSESTGWGVNEDVFIRRTFDLTGFDLATVALSGTWRLADWTFGISLNGNLIAGTAIGNCGGDQGACGTWFSDHLLSVVAGSPFFVQGINTLEFRGQSLNSAYDGLWFAGEVTGVRAVPEPVALVLVVTALGSFAAARRRA